MELRCTNISFGEKYPTGHILEITSRKIFEPDGVTGYINKMKKLHGNVPKYTGHLGYRRYAEIVGNKIMAKYPKIKEATDEILDIANNFSYVHTSQLKEKVQPILDRFDKEIDIVI